MQVSEKILLTGTGMVFISMAKMTGIFLKEAVFL